MNIWDIIIGILIAAIVVAALLHIRSNKKKGIHSCGGNCAGCTGCASGTCGGSGNNESLKK